MDHKMSVVNVQYISGHNHRHSHNSGSGPTNPPNANAGDPRKISLNANAGEPRKISLNANAGEPRKISLNSNPGEPRKISNTVTPPVTAVVSETPIPPSPPNSPHRGEESGPEKAPSPHHQNETAGKPQIWVRIKPTYLMDNGILKISDDRKSLNLMVDHEDRVVGRSSADNTPQEKEEYMGRSLIFEADGILENSNQEETYNEIVDSAVEKAMSGTSGVILSLGPELSGKSFTMFGSWRKFQYRGLIPRAFEKIFQTIEQSPQQIQYRVKIGILEIRKDHVRDLLTLSPYDLKNIGPNGPIGMHLQQIGCAEHGLGLLIRALTIQKHLPRDDPSSRFHTIVYIDIDAEATLESGRMFSKARLTFAKIAAVPKRAKLFIGPEGTEQPREILRHDNCVYVDPKPKMYEFLTQPNRPSTCCRPVAGEMGEAIAIRRDLFILEQMFVRSNELRRLNRYYNKLKRYGMQVFMKKPKPSPSQYFRQSKLAHCLQDIVSGSTEIRIILHLRLEPQYMYTALEIMRFAERAKCVPFESTSTISLGEQYQNELKNQKRSQTIAQFQAQLDDVEKEFTTRGPELTASFVHLKLDELKNQIDALTIKTTTKPSESKVATKTSEPKVAAKTSESKVATKTSESKVATQPNESQVEAKPIESKPVLEAVEADVDPELGAQLMKIYENFKQTWQSNFEADEEDAGRKKSPEDYEAEGSETKEPKESRKKSKRDKRQKSNKNKEARKSAGKGSFHMNQEAGDDLGQSDAGNTSAGSIEVLAQENKKNSPVSAQSPPLPLPDAENPKAKQPSNIDITQPPATASGLLKPANSLEMISEEMETELPSKAEAWNLFIQTENGAQLSQELAQKQHELQESALEHTNVLKILSNLLSKNNQKQTELDLFQQERHLKGEIYDENDYVVILPEEKNCLTELKALHTQRDELLDKVKIMKGAILEQKKNIDLLKMNSDLAFQDYCMENFAMIFEGDESCLEEEHMHTQLPQPFIINDLASCQCRTDEEIERHFEQLKAMAKEQAKYILKQMPKRKPWIKY